MKSLNPKQEAFAKAIAAGYSPAAAYVKAGFQHNPGNAYRMSQKEYIRNRLEVIRSGIAATHSESVKSTGITVARTLEELGHIGFADIGDMFTDDGYLKPIKSVPEGLRRAIASVEVVTQKRGSGEDVEVEYVHKVRLHDKNSALDKIAKHLQMYLEHEVSQNSVAAQFADAIKRAIDAKPALPVGPGPRPYLSVVKTPVDS